MKKYFNRRKERLVNRQYNTTANCPILNLDNSC